MIFDIIKNNENIENCLILRQLTQVIVVIGSPLKLLHNYCLKSR